MKTLGRFEFPEQGNRDECDTWKPFVTRTALHSTVLIVAKTRIEGTWRAYCGSVPGQNHDNEMEPVLRNGDRVPEKIARVMFPCFDGVPYAR